MALGATRGNVKGQVLFEGLRLAFIGLALGVPISLIRGAHRGFAEAVARRGDGGLDVGDGDFTFWVFRP